MKYYGVRKAVEKQKGPRGPYIFIMLPPKFVRMFNVKKGETFSVYATGKGNLILRRVGK
jgi:hypothetical protein